MRRSDNVLDVFWTFYVRSVSKVSYIWENLFIRVFNAERLFSTNEINKIVDALEHGYRKEVIPIKNSKEYISLKLGLAIPLRFQKASQ